MEGSAVDALIETVRKTAFFFRFCHVFLMSATLKKNSVFAYLIMFETLFPQIRMALAFIECNFKKQQTYLQL